MACMLVLDEHKVPCDNPEHVKAILDRDQNAPPWATIEHRHTSTGPRDYLNDRPIHCGDILCLQAISYHSDDYGDYTLHTSKGRSVRYELQAPAPGVRPADRIVLYVSIAGYFFTSSYSPSMRFRWPDEVSEHDRLREAAP